MRRSHLGLAVAGAVALVLAVTALYQRVQNGDEDLPTRTTTVTELEPLPAGPPKKTSAEASTGRATLDDMVADAPVVFIGRVMAIGGSEVVSPAGPVDAGRAEGFELTVHRTRFDVIEAMRGDVSLVDIAQFDVEDAVRFGIGETHLVFAHEVQLGSLKLPYIVPYGYQQGIYLQVAPGLFSNEVNGSIALATLENRLKGSPK